MCGEGRSILVSRTGGPRGGKGVSGPGRCWSSKVGAALGTRAMGARGQQRTQSRGGRRYPSLGRKGGNYHRGIVVAWARTAGRVAAVGGRGRYEPQLPQPGGRAAGVGGRPWFALPDDAHIHRLGFGCICWGSLSKSKFRQLDELQSSWRLSAWGGGTAWWARPSVLIPRPGIWDETWRPPPHHLGSPDSCP